MHQSLLFCLLSATALSVQVGAFAPTGLAPLTRRTTAPSSSSAFLPQTSLFVSSSEGNNSAGTSNRRRRKRKDGRNLKAEEPDVSAPAAPDIVEEEEAGQVVEPTAAAAPSTAEPAKKSSEVVTMEVRDVRDILSGKPAPSASVGDATDADVDAEELADDEEWEYYYEDEEGNEVEPPAEGSLEQLLADAKKLRGDNESEKSDEGALGGVSIPGGIKGAISTIVTIDFFFVLGLLAWFLAGIFVRAAFGNDAVQIAFNNNFELIVQPALGVLMIASAAGVLFKEPEEDDRGLS